MCGGGGRTSSRLLLLGLALMLMSLSELWVLGISMVDR